MHLKLVAAFLLLAVASTQSTELRCEYRISPYQRRDYECQGFITTTGSDFTVGSVTGTHIAGMGNDEVNEIMFSNVSMEAMPKNLASFFRNYREFGMANIANFPNFRRAFFADYTHLTYFFSYNLPMVTEIPRDAFYDMTKLTYLYLDGMTNMKNFNVDMLVKMPYLEYFSARGPNQVNQIFPGFFRTQVNTLKTVDFRDTNLVKIGFSTFQNFGALREARFANSGCLNRIYFENVVPTLTAEIRSRCQDVNGQENNEIYKNKHSSSSSSE